MISEGEVSDVTLIRRYKAESLKGGLSLVWNRMKRSPCVWRMEEKKRIVQVIEGRREREEVQGHVPAGHRM